MSKTYQPTSELTTLPPCVKGKKARALTVRNVYDKKFKTISLSDKWRSAIGKPEFTGTWFIYGPPKHGKTSFALQLSKYLTSFGKVLYVTAEEGISLAFRKAMQCHQIEDVEKNWFVIDRRDVPNISDLVSVLLRQRSPKVVFIDSVLFYNMKQTEYRKLKKMFPDKLFVYVSHVNSSGEPKGATADEIWRDAMVYFKVSGFRAFPVSRYGGGEPIDVCPELAEKYWGNVISITN